MNRQATLVALFAILVPSICFGWGREGHRIIGNIAAKLLTPKAAAAVKDLLGEQTLADVSMWADEIERDRDYEWASPLHYAHVDPGHDGFDLHRDCPEKGCVVSAIIKYSHVLGDKSAPRQERIEALKFLIHFVGDIHQPLHVSHARDKRGNDTEVTFFGEHTDLHSVWDSGMIRRAKQEDQSYAFNLESTFHEEAMLQRGKKHWKDWSKQEENEYIIQLVVKALPRDPAAWATKSYKLAVSNAYAIPNDGRLGQDYFDKNIPVVNDRMFFAGLRLGCLLNVILDETAKKAIGLPF